jgi:methyl-accepting chemotaxis protein
MRAFDNLKIPVKIAALLLLLGLLTLAVTLFSNSRLSATDASYEELVDVELPNTTSLVRTHRRLTEMVYAGYQRLAYPGGSAGADRAIASEAEAHQLALKNLDDVIAAEPDLAPTLRELRDQSADLHKIMLEAMELADQSRDDESRAMLARADALLAKAGDLLRPINDARVADADRMSDELGLAAESTARTTLLGSLIGIAAALASGLYLSRRFITGPLTRVKEKMEQLVRGDHEFEVPCAGRGDEIGEMAKAVLVFRDAAIAQKRAEAEKARSEADQKMVVETVSEHLALMASGDLTRPIAAEFPPAYTGLRSNFNAAVDSLRGLVSAVSESASAIETGAGEIGQASEDLARRTESNAASLEETAAAVGQMDGRLRATATAAARTVERADQTIATVSGGRAVTDEAVQAMGRVAESAKGIDSVIEGLDKIAFQTRVLAMNAAVEAGRAGDAGRGFAVVADLVSALAMRSEEEAKRARDQLTATQTDIVQAVDAVTKVDGALADISGDVAQVHELLATMAADNQAQSTAITEISTAIGAMDQATQQNAAMVEETSAAARSLNNEVAALTSRASAFNTGSGAASARAASVTAIRRPAAPALHTGGHGANGSGSPVRRLQAAAGRAFARPAAEAQDDWSEF